jgi:hypothetical protein
MGGNKSGLNGSKTYERSVMSGESVFMVGGKRTYVNRRHNLCHKIDIIIYK